jgi:hypothetical protein
VDLYEELRSIVDALTTASVSYALVGGVAVSIYATPRATEDIDLLIAGEDAERAIQALMPCGFRPPGRPMDVAQGRLRILRLLKFEGEDLLPLDLLVPIDPDLARLLDDRASRDLGGRLVHVIGRRSLRALKRLRGSPQDLADLAALGPEDPAESG